MNKNISELQQIFKYSTDAIFGIDTSGNICFMNNNCESLLGFSETDLHGKACAEILCGLDMHGEAVCGKNCPVRQMAAGDLPFEGFDMMVKRKNGNSILVNVGASYTSAKVQQKYNNVDVILNLRRIDSQRLLQRMSSSNKTANSHNQRTGILTNREKEILTLASDGITTQQIAEQSCISIETVRNHFKNILIKLGAHSRTEAVSMAFRQNLIS